MPRTRKQIIEQIHKDLNDNTQFGAGLTMVGLTQLEVLLDIRDIVEGIDRRLGAINKKNGN